MGWFEKMKRGIHKVNRFVAGVSGFFLIPLMLITAFDVVGRDVFNHPIPGTVELSQYMLAVFILLGLAYAQQMKAHVAVSILTSQLNNSAQVVLNMIATILCLFISFVLLWQGWVVGIEEKTVSDMLRVPQFPFRILVAVAAFLMCFEFLIDFVETLKKLAGRSS